MPPLDIQLLNSNFKEKHFLLNNEDLKFEKDFIIRHKEIVKSALTDRQKSVQESKKLQLHSMTTATTSLIRPASSCTIPV